MTPTRARDAGTGTAWLFFTDGEQVVFKLEEGKSEIDMPDGGYSDGWIRQRLRQGKGWQYTAWPACRVAKVVVTLDDDGDD